MKILLDTHVIIWTLTDDERLPEREKNLISDMSHIIYYSVASLWEIAIKNQKAPERCPYQEQDVMKYCEEAGFLPVYIQPTHVMELRSLRIFDPFDRILLAQAKAEQCKLITHDKIFENYDEECILLI